MIAVRALRKTYGSTLALNNASFDVLDGLVTGLLGPNGAGKTTTVRAITGLVAPDAGGVEVDGVDVASHPLLVRARLGVVPESIGVYDHLSVLEHLTYSAELQAVPPEEIASRTADVLEQLGLTPLAARRAVGLSLGERRRLALARALVHGPANLVFDEPTNGLDVLGARSVRRDIRQLAARGRAVLVSSHVMPEVAVLCDRVVVMARGAIVASGTPEDLIKHAGCTSLEDAFVRILGSEEGLN